MRELVLITLRIVDETNQFLPEEAASFFTPDYTDHRAINAMNKLERVDPARGAVCQTAEGTEAYQPRSAMTVVQIEPCNIDSALGSMIALNCDAFVGSCISALSKAGLKILDRENSDRSELDRVSKTLGGDGVESTEMIQFYAVFSLTAVGESVLANLEGVLRLDKIDMAIDEAVLL